MSEVRCKVCNRSSRRWFIIESVNTAEGETKIPESEKIIALCFDHYLEANPGAYQEGAWGNPEYSHDLYDNIGQSGDTSSTA